MKNKYKFYYDESFHDRALTKKGKNMNIDLINQSYYFITCTVGFEEDNRSKLLKQFQLFESRTKLLLRMSESQELKGTTIRKKNFKKGIRSFNRNTISIYSEYFDLFTEEYIFQITIINKFEYLILSIFPKIYYTSEYVKIRRFIYTLVKIVDLYKDEEFIDKIFDENTKKNEILDLIIAKIDDIVHSLGQRIQEKEIRKNLLNVRQFLTENYIDVNLSEKYPWDYSWSIEGFKNFLYTEGIDIETVCLYIDNDLNTVNAANEYNFNRVYSVMSDESPWIRISDIFANFFGRLIESIDQERIISWKRNNKLNSSNNRVVLDRSWFCISKEQYELYKKIHLLLQSKIDIKSNVINSIRLGDYTESARLLFSLIKYIGGDFNSYEMYCNIEGSVHEKQFNKFYINDLRGFFKTL